MRNQRSGFSLVEMVVVALLGSITLAAIYQSLIVQERAYRREGAIIATHESLRSAVGVLEAEMREISATAELADAGSDLAMIAAESLEFRALRKIGFVCDVHNSDRKLDTFEVGASFAQYDSVLIFQEGDAGDWDDDGWIVGLVSSVGTPKTTTCNSDWGGVGAAGVNFGGGLLSAIVGSTNLADVAPGAPLRSFEWLTYGLYQVDGEWVLGRHKRDDSTINVLVDGLAAPADSGLVFYYYDADGLETNVADEVVRIQINVRAMADPANMIFGDTLRTNLFLRNN